jgi:hypothetical protein
VAKESKSMRRCGFLVKNCPGNEVYNAEKKKIGIIKRLGYSPVLERKIAIGYIEESYFAKGELLSTDLNDQKNEDKLVTPCHLPFVFLSLRANLGVHPTIFDRRGVPICDGTDKCSQIFREYMEPGVFANVENLKGKYDSLLDIFL